MPNQMSPLIQMILGEMMRQGIGGATRGLGTAPTLGTPEDDARAIPQPPPLGPIPPQGPPPAAPRPLPPGADISQFRLPEGGAPTDQGPSPEGLLSDIEGRHVWQAIKTLIAGNEYSGGSGPVEAAAFMSSQFPKTPPAPAGDGLGGTFTPPAGTSGGRTSAAGFPLPQIPSSAPAGAEAPSGGPLDALRFQLCPVDPAQTNTRTPLNVGNRALEVPGGVNLGPKVTDDDLLGESIVSDVRGVAPPQPDPSFGATFLEGMFSSLVPALVAFAANRFEAPEVVQLYAQQEAKKLQQAQMRIEQEAQQYEMFKDERSAALAREGRDFANANARAGILDQAREIQKGFTDGTYTNPAVGVSQLIALAEIMEAMDGDGEELLQLHPIPQWELFQVLREQVNDDVKVAGGGERADYEFRNLAKYINPLEPDGEPLTGEMVLAMLGHVDENGYVSLPMVSETRAITQRLDDGGSITRHMAVGDLQNPDGSAREFYSSPVQLPGRVSAQVVQYADGRAIVKRWNTISGEMLPDVEFAVPETGMIADMFDDLSNIDSLSPMLAAATIIMGETGYIGPIDPNDARLVATGTDEDLNRILEKYLSMAGGSTFGGAM